MNNTVIGYLDGYLVKEAEEPYRRGESLFHRQEDYDKFKGTLGHLSAEEQGQHYDLIYAKAAAVYMDDFIHGVASGETSRKLGAAAAGGGMFALMGGLMGGTKGAVVGGLLGALIGFVAEAMGIIPAEAWEKLAQWRENDAVEEEIDKLAVAMKANGKEVPKDVQDALGKVDAETTLAVQQDRLKILQGLPNKNDADINEISLLNRDIRKTTGEVISQVSQQQTDEEVDQNRMASPEWMHPVVEKMYRRELYAANKNVNDLTVEYTTAKAQPGYDNPDALQKYKEDMAAAQKHVDLVRRSWHTGVSTSRFGFYGSGDKLPQFMGVGAWDEMDESYRNAKSLEDIYAMKGIYHGGLNRAWKHRRGYNWDDRGSSVPLVDEMLNPGDIAMAELAKDKNLRGFMGAHQFAKYFPGDKAWKGWRDDLEEGDVAGRMANEMLSLNRAIRAGGEGGATAQAEKDRRLAMTKPIIKPTSNYISDASGQGPGGWLKYVIPGINPPKELPAPTKEEIKDATIRRGDPMGNKKEGSSRFIGMPWRDAQKLAAPVQQAAPMDPVPQAPSEKDIFDHKAKMEEMQMQQQLIGAKAQASHAASAQVTQTSKAKAQEAAQSMGQGDQSTGGQPQTAMAGSMSQNHPQTQPQSTPDQPGTPMPEAQWTAPTTV